MSKQTKIYYEPVKRKSTVAKLKFCYSVDVLIPVGSNIDSIQANIAMGILSAVSDNGGEIYAADDDRDWVKIRQIKAREEN